MANLPLTPVQDLRTRINAQLEDFWEKIGTHHTGVSGRAYHGVPAETDVSTGAEGLRIEIELPGMDETDIEVSIRDRILTIGGEKRLARDIEEPRFHLSERAYGRFERHFALPDTVDAEKIAASYRNGVLSVTAPLKKGVKPAAKRIEIETR